MVTAYFSVGALKKFINFCIELCSCSLQGWGGVAARLPNLGGVQRATTSHVLPSFTGKGTTPGQLLCH